MHARTTPGDAPAPAGQPPFAPRLSVVVPAFNQQGSIRENLGTIERRLETLGVPFEIVVVSDGSADRTYDEARRHESPRVRVLDYHRNLGKGYALRTGSREARGAMIAWIDSDLDLDPAALRGFVDLMDAGDVDVVIGSKRHPQSVVDYPAKRRVYSWMYQQLVRVLFSLDVRDTQVGMKLFRREVLDEVLPVVLVKRYAFDLEMLAVATHFGHRRIVEAPIVLDYQFSGTGVNWRAIATALWDTAAVFYRLRILGYYDRKHRLAARIARFGHPAVPSLTVVTRAPAWDDATRARVDALVDRTPAGTNVRVVVDVPAASHASADGLVVAASGGPGGLLDAAIAATTDVVAIVDGESWPSSRWADAALQAFADPGVGAVVGPIVPRFDGEILRDAAGVLSESRIGVGGARTRHHVGALGEVDEHPAGNLFIRTPTLRSVAGAGDAELLDLCGRVAAIDQSVISSPDVVVTTRPEEPLFAPYLGRLFEMGRGRGERMRRGERVRPRHLLPPALVCLVAVAPLAMGRRGPVGRAVRLGLGAYGLVIAGFAGTLMVLHRRVRLVAVTVAGAVASHVSFGAGILAGLAGLAARARGRDGIGR
ncbi:MAG: glycosyltransferase [Thermoleophilia bacterium]|nr:glycosyltransferase [Thermoleophilia bacterium]